MTTLQIIALVACFLIVDLVVVGAVITMATTSTRELAGAFPARPLLAGAVRREFQSISVNLFNFGGSFHIAADAACLHLEPVWVLRHFRAPAMSIPWSAIVFTGPPPARKRFVKARIGSAHVRFPAWALAAAQELGSRQAPG